jgi:hypothetical protein
MRGGNFLRQIVMLGFGGEFFKLFAQFFDEFIQSPLKPRTLFNRLKREKRTHRHRRCGLVRLFLLRYQNGN